MFQVLTAVVLVAVAVAVAEDIEEISFSGCDDCIEVKNLRIITVREL
jgi:hypothetical protein